MAKPFLTAMIAPWFKNHGETLSKAMIAPWFKNHGETLSKAMVWNISTDMV